LGRFRGKTVLVTGSGRGIGRETVLSFAKEGANVVINYKKRLESAEETYKQAKEYGVDALVVKCNVGIENDVKRMFKLIEEVFGGVDILVNNAGFGLVKPLIEVEGELWSKIIDYNLKGAYLCSKYALKYMIEKRWGRIINVASIAGLFGRENLTPYSAAKAGLIGFTRSLALEVRKYNITVNAVAPGLTLTDLGVSQLKLIREMHNLNVDIEEVAERWARKHTLIGRIIEPWEVARVILFLADPDSSAITGQVIIIDGGQSLVEFTRHYEI